MNSTSDITVGRKGQVICRPSEWTDVVIFFFLNYGLHALTIITTPGATTLMTAQLCLYAIFTPFAGSLQALSVIYRFTMLEADPLVVAHRSGALCVVLRSKDAYGHRLTEVSPAHINIHGLHPVEIPGIWKRVKGVFALRHHTDDLHVFMNNHHHHHTDDVERVGPDTYRIFEVPQDFIVKPLIETATNDGSATGNHSQKGPKFQLSCNYNYIKSVAAILQILYSSFEIYEARGLQLQQFGYAAYSLTVIPYTIMSLVNLVASLCEPQYPTRFLVNYRRKIETQAGETNPDSGHDSLPTGGEIGDINTSITTNTQQTEVVVSGAVGVALKGKRHERGLAMVLIMKTVVGLIGVSSFAAPYIIMKLLTDFHGGQSTRNQRVWIMSWLVIGQYLAPIVLFCIFSPQHLKDLMKDPYQDKGTTRNPSNQLEIHIKIVLLLMIAVCPVGGFVVIAKMIRHSNVCKTI